jgi:hypothetical protein
MFWRSCGLHERSGTCPSDAGPALTRMTNSIGHNTRFQMWLRRLLAAALIAFVCGVLFLAALMAAGALPVQDLAQYWSAAHLVRHNPYSPQLVAQFEHSHRIFVDPPLVFKNPPWVIPFVLPLGLFNYQVAFAAWTLFSIVIVIGCARAVWQDLNLPASLTPLILPLLFGPTIIQLMLGQCTILVFLGVAVFLLAAERRQDGIAGASLVLVLGKPHVALLLLIAVALWTVQQRRWRILVSGCLALLGTSLFVTILNPHIWSQFLERTTQVAHETEAYPNLGGMLYVITGVHALALIPQLAGLVWLAVYWRKHRENWSWWEHGTLVILCSVVCSYYSYPYDEILALPALMVAFSNGNRRAFVFAFALTNLGFLVYISNLAGYFGYGYMFLWWTPLGWLATFMLAQTRFLKRAEA